MLTLLPFAHHRRRTASRLCPSLRPLLPAQRLSGLGVHFVHSLPRLCSAPACPATAVPAPLQHRSARTAPPTPRARSRTASGFHGWGPPPAPRSSRVSHCRRCSSAAAAAAPLPGSTRSARSPARPSSFRGSGLASCRRLLNP
ncbi:hypothetical protein FB451DRAFT_1566644 [Mycena latifolia]|nr:hypothetical protein FB451DRAFT_1566644 [Mycena latifolia]